MKPAIQVANPIGVLVVCIRQIVLQSVPSRFAHASYCEVAAPLPRKHRPGGTSRRRRNMAMKALGLS